MKAKALKKIERLPLPPTGALGGTVVSLAQSAGSLGEYTATDFLRSSGGTLWGTLISAPKGAEENTQMVIGNLKDYYGYTDDIFGLAIGEFGAGKINLTLEQTNGLRIRYYTTPIITLDTDGNASFTGEIAASSGEIGGWSIGETSLSGGNATLSSTGYLLLGTGNNIARLDATNATYRFWIGHTTAASAPFSVTKDGLVYASNVIVSGSIHSAVFQRDLVQAQAGTLLITKSAGKITETYSVGGSLVVETPPGGGWLFETNDIVRIKDDTHETWITVTRTATTNVYTTTYSYGDNSVSYAAGTPAIDYGQSGQGFLVLTADAANAPYYSARTHNGSPWSAQVENVRLGNLNGSFGISTDKPGLGVGNYDSGNYLLATEDGVSLTSMDGSMVIDSDGLRFLLDESDSAYIRFVGKTDGYTHGGVTGYLDTGVTWISINAGDYPHTTGTIQIHAYDGFFENKLIGIILDGRTHSMLVHNHNGSLLQVGSTKVYIECDAEFFGDASVDGNIEAGGSVQGLELRLPTLTRFAEVGTGAGTSNYWTRNAYYDGSDWRRLQADQDACLVLLNASGFFGVFNATDTGNTVGSVITFTEHLRVSDTGRVRPYRLQLDLGDTLTISAGAITPTKSFHRVDTEGGGSTDDLETISGGASGDILILMPASDSRTVVLKHNTSGGNLKLARGDFSLDGLWDTIILISDGTYWYEISRSDNRA